MLRIRNTNIYMPKSNKTIAGLQIFYALFLLFVWSYSISTQSLVITNLSNVVLTNFLSVVTWTLSTWVIRKQANKYFTFGHVRFEIVAIFLIATLAQFNSINVVKECLLRLWMGQPEVDTSHISMTSFLVLMSQLVLIYFNEATRAMTSALAHSGSNLFQDQISRMSQRIFHMFPALNRNFLARVNPFVMFCWINMIFCLILQLLVEIYDSSTFDTLFALVLAPIFAVSLWPIFVYTALILMQAAPNHMITHLDKCLREVSTLEGVLEIRNEHFWSLGFGTIVGTLHVRVRRDANEQIILSHLNNRLSNLVSNLTIQIFKDEWAWNRPSRGTIHKDTMFNSSSYNYLSNTNMTNGNGFSALANNSINHIENPLNKGAPIQTEYEAPKSETQAAQKVSGQQTRTSSNSSSPPAPTKTSLPSSEVVPLKVSVSAPSPHQSSASDYVQPGQANVESQYLQEDQQQQRTLPKNLDNSSMNYKERDQVQAPSAQVCESSTRDPKRNVMNRPSSYSPSNDPTCGDRSKSSWMEDI